MNGTRQSRSPRPVTTPGVPDPERMQRASRRTRSREARSPTIMKVMRAFSEREDTLGALADQVASKEHPAEEERPMRTERAVLVSQATLRDAIAGIPGLIEDAVTALVTPEGDKRAKGADNRLQAMLQGLVNKTLDEKLNSAEFEERLLRKVEKASSSRSQVKKVTQAMLEDEDFIAPVATIVMKETKKAVHAGSEGKDRRQKFVEIAYSTGARSASSSDRPSTDISDELTNRKTYSESSEEAADLRPWNEITADQKPRRYKSIPDRGLDIPGLRVIDPVNDRFAAAVDYRNYRLLKKSSRFDDDVAHELHRMAKTIAVQMKDRNFSGKDPMSVIAFLQDFKSACDACGIHKGAAMWLFKQLHSGPAEAAVKAQVTLMNSIKFYHKGALKSYSAIVQFLLNRYVNDDSIAKLDTEVQNLRQESMAPTEYAQKLWTRTLSCGTVYDEKSLKALLVEGVTHPIRKALRHWWAEHQNVSLEDLAQRTESLLDLQGRWPQRKERRAAKTSGYPPEHYPKEEASDECRTKITPTRRLATSEFVIAREKLTAARPTSIELVV